MAPSETEFEQFLNPELIHLVEDRASDVSSGKMSCIYQKSITVCGHKMGVSHSSCDATQKSLQDTLTHVSYQLEIATQYNQNCINPTEL